MTGSFLLPCDITRLQVDHRPLLPAPFQGSAVRIGRQHQPVPRHGRDSRRGRVCTAAATELLRSHQGHPARTRADAKKEDLAREMQQRRVLGKRLR